MEGKDTAFCAPSKAKVLVGSVGSITHQERSGSQIKNRFSLLRSMFSIHACEGGGGGGGEGFREGIKKETGGHWRSPRVELMWHCRLWPRKVKSQGEHVVALKVPG